MGEQIISVVRQINFSKHVAATERVLVKSGIVLFGSSLLQKANVEKAGQYFIVHFGHPSPILKFHPKVKPVNGPYYISFERQILKERIFGLRYLYVLYFQPYLKKTQPDKILQFDIVDADIQADWKFPLVGSKNEYLAFNQVRLSKLTLKTQLS